MISTPRYHDYFDRLDDATPISLTAPTCGSLEVFLCGAQPVT
jgi:hypothetical protein